jgi:hypothetical protein
MITKQYYFNNKGNIIIQKDGLAIHAPSSGILSEVCLQYIETSHIPTLAKKHMFINYFCYIDDILLTFHSTNTNTQSIFTDFNSTPQPTLYHQG